MKKRNYLNYILTFLITFLIMNATFYLVGIAPFGDTALLGNDMNLQYMDYMQYMINMFKSNNLNLIYSVDITMGYDFLPLFMYYVSSPITLIFLFIASFFENIDMVNIVSILTILKISLASTTMYFYLNKHYKNNNLFIIFFALCYGLSSYNLEYGECLMWLDSVILLPLLLKLVDDFLVGKHKKLLVIFISYLMFSNFYTGYMAIMFSGLYFICNSLISDKEITFKALLVKLGDYILHVILGCCIVGVFLLPTMSSIINNRIIGYESVSKAGIKSLKSVFQIFVGQSNQFTLMDYPLIYSGLISIILLIYYFINNKNAKRNKIIYLVELSMMAIGLFVPLIDRIWHLFNYPLGYPFRYVFCLVFLIISIACESYLSIQKNDKKLIFIGILLLIVLQLGMFYKYSFTLKKVFLLNFLFVIISMATLYFGFKKIMMLAITTELFINCIMIYKVAEKEYISYEEYQNYDTLVKEHIEGDLTNYRLEKTFTRPSKERIDFSNESMFYGYNGISTYSSIYNEGVVNALDKLGYERWVFANIYSQINPFIDSVLGIKYVMSNDELPYEKINDYLYSNENAYRLVFKSDVNIDFKLSESAAVNQNRLSDLLIGKDIFRRIRYETDYFHNLYVYENNFSQKVICKNNIYDPAYYTLNFIDRPHEGNMLFAEFINPERNNSFGFVYDGGYQNIFAGKNDMLINFGEYSGENQLTIEQVSDLSKYSGLRIYELDMDDLNLLDKKISYDYVLDKNTIKTNSKEKEYLYLSIADADCLNIKVNGQKIKSEKWLNELIKIPLDEGENTIEFAYNYSKFGFGFCTSVIGLTVYLFLIKKGAHNGKIS